MAPSQSIKRVRDPSSSTSDERFGGSHEKFTSSVDHSGHHPATFWCTYVAVPRNTYKAGL